MGSSVAEHHLQVENLSNDPLDDDLNVRRNPQARAPCARVPIYQPLQAARNGEQLQGHFTKTPTETPAAVALLKFLASRPLHPARRAIQAVSTLQEQQLLERAVWLPLDMVEIMHYSIPLACAILENPEVLRQSLMGLLYSEGLIKAKLPRLWLQPTQVVQDSSSILDVCKRVTSHYQQEASNKNSSVLCTPPRAISHLMVSILGVVHSISTPYIRTYSKAWRCEECGDVTETLSISSHGEPYQGNIEQGSSSNNNLCCCKPVSEDMSLRVNVPCQDLWLIDPDSALKSPYQDKIFSVNKSSLMVRLVDCLSLQPGSEGIRSGDTIQVIGRAHLNPALPLPGSTAAIATVEIEATSVSFVNLHSSWGVVRGQQLESSNTTTSSTDSMSAAPNLQLLCNLLEEALGLPLPHEVSIAILISAAAVYCPTGRREVLYEGGEGESCNNKSKDHHRQLSLLFYQESHCPVILQRILRPSAHMLCPHSMLMTSAHVAAGGAPGNVPLVVPMVAKEPIQGCQAPVIHPSLLTLTSCGILVADGIILSGDGANKRQRLQMTEAMTKGNLIVNTGSRQGLLELPVTTTVWATSHGSPLPDGHQQLIGSGASRATLPTGALPPDGFDILLVYPYDEEVVVCDILFQRDEEESKGAVASDGGAEARGGPAAATDLLRKYFSSSALLQGNNNLEDRNSHFNILNSKTLETKQKTEKSAAQPSLTDDSLQLLQRYVVSVRQSSIGAQVPHTQVISLLLRCCRSSAQLQQRQVVLPTDCVVAILLTETTLRNRLGSTYHNTCMPLMELSNAKPLEQQLFALYQVLELQLSNVAPTVSSVSGDWPAGSLFD